MQLVASGVERERKKGRKSRGSKYERREEEKMRRKVREQERRYGIEAKVRRNVRNGVGADFLWR